MTRTERAYTYTKQRVLDATYAGGDLLTEGEVADALGISRTPVREAFLRLEGEGLLRLYPKRGALVVPVAASEIEDVFEARLLVEEHCARRAATAGGRVLEMELEEAIAEQERAIGMGEGGMAEFAKHDRRFHRAIVAAAGNALLARSYDALADRHQRIAATTVARDPSRIERFISEHREITAALAAGEAEKAAELLREHLSGARALARRRA